ncbi:hypothetical protein JJQ72_14420 [Paenibacillus sp. F411]|uniref:Uncharacterized protein n=1 Tax=Paenibacillus algicola TaxID=2565926 RepID=A0A4P8XPT4_9BACL|nr:MULTISPECIES: hypothetical protein [Paenibacillus]MBO2945169.1 hypothetical protein [Paenibacillus sp. F411]QCT02409.1 hypothetical protein E6C60_1694 [Paenibacillus algicola]
MNRIPVVLIADDDPEIRDVLHIYLSILHNFIFNAKTAGFTRIKADPVASF